MKENYTHIILLIDKSGSMTSIKRDMEGGLKEFIEKQKLEKGKCTVTAAQFDHTYQVIHKMKNLQEIEDITINPRGSTALIDSMCKLIDEVGVELAALPTEERPDKVLFINITDGEENASVEFTNEQLKEKIALQEETYKWLFTYIGANQDAFGVARKIGTSHSSTLQYTTTSTGTGTMFAAMTKATSRYRSTSFGITGSRDFYTIDEQEMVANTK